MFLKVRSGAGPELSIEVTGPKFTIGRADDCDLVLEDDKVSRHHALIEVAPDGTATIRDLGSSNGTFVAGTRITEPTPITVGELLQIGHTAIEPVADRLAAPTVLAPVPPPPPVPARPLGRSTIQRLVEEEVREELAVEERRMQRRTRIAIGLAAVAVLVAAAAIGVLFASGAIGGGGGSGPSIDALERATVLITGLDGNGNALYIGSGSIVRPDGYILTNAHVGKPSAPGLAVEYGLGMQESDPASLQISLFQGEAKPARAQYLARPVAYDGYADVAVLKIVKSLDGKPVSHLDLPSVQLGDSNRLHDGDPVIVVGYPGVGGGFEGQINVSRGAISGFQSERHINGRAWIKTDAAIAHGNSGGLAADSHGRLIGIPSRFQCGSSLFGECNSSDDKQGRIRPVALALPIIEAGQAGQPWTDRFLVAGSGHERFAFSGWAAAAPGAGCSFQKASSYPSGKTLYAVFNASGMTTGEDLDALVTYRRDASSAPRFNQTLLSWTESGPADSCFWISVPTGQGDGMYSLQMFGGPSLARLSDELTVRSGVAAS